MRGWEGYSARRKSLTRRPGPWEEEGKRTQDGGGGRGRGSMIELDPAKHGRVNYRASCCALLNAFERLVFTST